MCGIVGLLGGGSKDELSSMLDSIEHRGPDAKGVYYNDESKVYLGHARLSIIDLDERSNQPLWDANEKACIVFNGEIYNYKELREQLIREKGVSFKTKGDAEVILNLYLHSEEGWLEQLNGMFAFAIWNPEYNTTLLVRDGFGVKPLYYTNTKEGFAFSSEMKSFFKLSSFIKTIDFDALLRTVVFLWSPGPATIMNSVHKLEPGHWLEVKDKIIVNRGKYWKWPDYSPKSDDVNTVIENVQSAMEKSVERQMVSDVEVGAFLSGGVDSSFIVSIANGLNPKKALSCFSIENLNETDNDGFVDDLPFAKKVANDLGCSLNVVKVAPDLVNDLSKMIYHLDEPQADPAPLNVLYICELAKQKDIKVLLSGAGGDDIYSGYRRHLALKLEKFWKGFPKSIRKGIQHLATNMNASSSTLRRVSKAFKYAGLDENERILSYFYWLPPERAFKLFSKEVQAKLSVNPLADILQDLEHQNISEPLEKMLYLERKHFLVDHNFNYTDKMSMAAGVEVRVPFLDKDLVSQASEISTDLKVKGRETKWVLKKSAEKYLDSDILYRSKTGFGAPLRTWLKNELKDFVDDLLGEKSIESRGIFNYQEVNKLIQDDRNGKDDFSYPIFSLICIELWFRIFLDDDKRFLNS